MQERPMVRGKVATVRSTRVDYFPIMYLPSIYVPLSGLGCSNKSYSCQHTHSEAGQVNLLASICLIRGSANRTLFRYVAGL